MDAILAEFDRIRELLEKRQVAEAQGRLEGVNPAALPAGQRGRYCGLEAVAMFCSGHKEAAFAYVGSVLAEFGDDPEFPALVDGLYGGLTSVRVRGTMNMRLHVAKVLARAYESLREPGMAAEVLAYLWYELPDQIWLCREIATALRLDGRPELAAQAMEFYVEADPEDAKAWASLGDYLDDAGREQEAELAWLRAADLDPGDPTLYYNWGIAAGRRGDLDRVRLCIDALRRIDEDEPLALALSSIPLEAEGEIWPGWQALRQALDRETDTARAAAVAHRALRYAERNGLIAAACLLADELHRRHLVDDEILEMVNRIEFPDPVPAHDYSVLVDVLPGADAAVRSRHWTRVVARSPDEASTLAIAFERRCGARDVRIGEVSDRGELPCLAHLGVWCVHDFDEIASEEDELDEEELRRLEEMFREEEEEGYE